MPEEIEVPTEHLHETLHEGAHHAGDGPPVWVSKVALTAAVLAVLAALSALKAGEHANEAMLEQMRATDEWAYFQAKGIKASLVESKMDILSRMEKSAPTAEELEKLKKYRDEQKEIEEKAKHEENESQHHMAHHEMLAKSVTAFQVSIALAAISVLSRKKWLWFASIVLGVGGAGLFTWGILV